MLLALPEEPTAPAGVTLVDARTILTAASGFIRRYRYTLNPYSGCRFACEYCYARAFAPTPEKRETWGEWVSAKQNAAALIAKACRDAALRGACAVISNHDNSTTRALYAGADERHELLVGRRISCRPGGRTAVPELLVVYRPRRQKRGVLIAPVTPGEIYLKEPE